MHVYIGMIAGGRAGEKYTCTPAEIALDEDILAERMDMGEIPDITPNDGDLGRVIETLEQGKIFVDHDVYGEGVIALTSNKNELVVMELLVRKMFACD